jgi:hypothetical protein
MVIFSVFPTNNQSPAPKISKKKLSFSLISRGKAKE